MTPIRVVTLVTVQVCLGGRLMPSVQRRNERGTRDRSRGKGRLVWGRIGEGFLVGRVGDPGSHRVSEGEGLEWSKHEILTAVT